jgi:acyl-coenzyme A thioesterase 13
MLNKVQQSLRSDVIPQDKTMSEIPEGFEPIFRTSPYLDLLGPIYNKKTEQGLIVGLRAEEKHCNARNLVHGGVFSSLADIALGYNAAFQGEKPTPMVTASLTIDYAGSAKLGDWIEINTDVQKVGKSMAFANCYFTVGTKRIVRASGVFGVVGT